MAKRTLKELLDELSRIHEELGDLDVTHFFTCGNEQKEQGGFMSAIHGSAPELSSQIVSAVDGGDKLAVLAHLGLNILRFIKYTFGGTLPLPNVEIVDGSQLPQELKDALFAALGDKEDPTTKH